MKPDEQEDTADDGGTGAGSWVAHPFTRNAHKALLKRLEKASLELVHKCSQTTDPVVRGAYERVEELKIQAEFFKKAGAK